MVGRASHVSARARICQLPRGRTLPPGPAGTGSQEGWAEDGQERQRGGSEALDPERPLEKGLGPRLSVPFSKPSVRKIVLNADNVCTKLESPVFSKWTVIAQKDILLSGDSWGGGGAEGSALCPARTGRARADAKLSAGHSGSSSCCCHGGLSGLRKELREHNRL